MKSNQLTPQEAILGVWVMENSASDKIEFLPNGIVNSYEDDVLQNSETYSISNECGGFTSSVDNHFLKTIDSEDGTEYCEIINGIDNSVGGFLSLTDDNGRLVIYVKP